MTRIRPERSGERTWTRTQRDPGPHALPRPSSIRKPPSRTALNLRMIGIIWGSVRTISKASSISFSEGRGGLTTKRRSKNWRPSIVYQRSIAVAFE
jgi:hypothetical protein